MVGASKNKFCTAGNGTELSDFQFIVVNRVMIKNIILFKLSGVIYKIVIHGKLTNGNAWVGDYTFQIDCFPIVCPRIYFVARYIHGYHLILSLFVYILMQRKSAFQYTERFGYVLYKKGLQSAAPNRYFW